MLFVFDMTIVWTLLTVLALIVLDTLLGVTIAFSKGTFDPRQLPAFLKNNLLPYVGALSLLAIGAMSLDVIKALFFASAAAAIAKFLADVKDKLMSIFGKLDFGQ
ncbi:MAG: hypothetical protein Q8S19_05135 [Bacillota bacterium]|nr:hypothetical protein [Bacillota bacterium]